MATSKMTMTERQRYKKLEIRIHPTSSSTDDFTLFAAVGSLEYLDLQKKIKSMSGSGFSTRNQRKVCSLFLLSGLGVLVCLFCYASYFPSGRVGGYNVWINPAGNTNVNTSSPKSKTVKSLKSFQSLWKFRTSATSTSTHEINQLESSGTPSWVKVATGSGSGKEETRSVRTEERRSCNFPRLNPFDPSITEFIKEPPNINCFTNYPLIFRTNFRNQLIQVKNLHNATCCYKTVSRETESDQNIKYSKKCHPISSTSTSTEIPFSHEFISVKCTQPLSNAPVPSPPKPKPTTSTSTTHKDMFAFVPLKPEVESRIKLYEQTFKQRQLLKDNGDDRLSILILGLDAQSHMNFIRQMPLTYNFLIKNLSAIGLQGYTKVGDNTFPNVIPLLSGLTVSELKKGCWPTKTSYFDKCPFIWNKFASSGYRTSFAEDSIWMGTFNYEKKGFQNPPTDYYLHPLALLMAKKIGHETWGNAKLCYGPRLGFEILLDYILKTGVAFRNKLYFQYVWANSLFHDYLNNPKLGDELLHLNLDYLSRNGLLNNTLVILLSDHGIRWGSIRSTYQGKIEERMPLAYFAFPEWFRQKYPSEMKILAENANSRLTTPFDIHETLLHILKINEISTKRLGAKYFNYKFSDETNLGENNRNKIPRGISLLKPIGLDRTCKTARIEEHWCVCNSMKTISRNSSLVIKAANFIVLGINQALAKYSGSCAKLTLYKINEAMRKIDGDIDTGSDLELYFNQSSIFLAKSSNLSTTTTTVESAKATDVGRMEKDININKNVSGHLNTNVSRKLQLQITLVTKPGFAVFEGTVYGDFEGKYWNISGEISRLNLYREQSLCIKDYVAQKYCYCLDQLELDEDMEHQDQEEGLSKVK